MSKNLEFVSVDDEIIVATDIVKSFQTGGERITVLDHRNITVQEGTLTILKGRSGSGKTTLMNILCALDKPDSGSVFIDKKDIINISEKKREELRRESMGIIFQSVALIPVMTAYENVDFALRLSGYKGDHDERIRHVLTSVGLENRMNHFPLQMSGGEQQRVAIARAIAHKPKVIFADEPTGALDTQAGLNVMKLFRELIDEEKITVVMTTHDPNLMDMADQVYEM